MSKISGQFLISGQFQDICEISGISGQLEALRTMTELSCGERISMVNMFCRNNTGMQQTDRQTDSDNCCIHITSHCWLKMSYLISSNSQTPKSNQPITGFVDSSTVISSAVLTDKLAVL